MTMSNLRWLNLGLRATMELGIVLALGYWGFETGSSAGMKVLLCIGTPLLGFGFWGLVDFRQAGAWAETLRLIQELLISGLAAFALYALEARMLGYTLALISLSHHILVYVLKDTLLKQATQ